MKHLLMVFMFLFIFTLSLSADKVILIGSGAPDPVDALIIERLNKFGLTVESHAHNEKHPVNLNGAILLFISESITSGNVLGAYKDSPIPVVNCESYIYDDMGFTPNDTGFNIDPGDTLTIIKDNHPITQGIPKKVKVYNSSIILMTVSNLAGDFTALAVREDNEALVGISIYEKGAKTATGETKARHVNIFPHSTGWVSLTADGWKLVENSILYALGRSLSVEPLDKLATTWASMKK